MKIRNLIGATLAIGLIVGAYLGGMLPKFGTGPGIGVGIPGGSGTGSSQPAMTPPPDKAKPDAEKEPPSPPDDPQVLAVLVEEEHYAIGERAGNRREYRPASLNTLVEAARQHAGNADGIRVRVARRKSRAAAEIRLRDELFKAGLTEDAIEWQDGHKP